jgi:hypothetical protein
MILEHSPGISKPSKLTTQLEKKKAEELPGPGPANYCPDKYNEYIKRTSIAKTSPRRPSIDRLNITLKLYDPKWQKGLIGTQSSEVVSPSSYKPFIHRKSSPAKFQNEKTDRLLIKVKDFSPSPHSYDVVSGLSMCSGLEKKKSPEVVTQTKLIKPREGKSFYLAPKIKGGVIGTSSRSDII